MIISTESKDFVKHFKISVRKKCRNDKLGVNLQVTRSMNAIVCERGLVTLIL